MEGPGAGTFITVVGLQVDGRWHDGVLTGAYLRQGGPRGGWAACGLQFLGDMRWSLAEHKSFGGRYWQELLMMRPYLGLGRHQDHLLPSGESGHVLQARPQLGLASVDFVCLPKCLIRPN